MTTQECYKSLHGDYANAKKRFMNDAIIERFLRKFLEDRTMSDILAAVEANDREQCFRAAHTMKGVAANMAFTELSQRAAILTEQLRSREHDADPALVNDVKEAYQLVIDTISGI